MPRRLHVPILAPGEVSLPKESAHHARDVLRLQIGATLELFDDVGNTASATLCRVSAGEVVADVGEIRPAAAPLGLTIASAVPKGPRADWMIEKLAEIGVDRFIPLATQRAVVLPEGTGKASRWQRLATEATRQSHRPGTMTIDTLTRLPDLLKQHVAKTAVFAATEEDGAPLATLLSPVKYPLLIFIGPEGGWTDDERRAFRENGLTPISLGRTILRTETAALVAAGIAASLTVT